MIILLLKNGKYKSINNISKIFNNIHNIEYVLINISTPLKGDMWTMIKGNTINNDCNIIEMFFKLDYSPIDVPWDEEFGSSNKVIINSLSTRYSIYPLVKEIMAINNFKEIYLDSYDNVRVSDLSFVSKDSYIVKLGEMSNKKMNKFFNNINMLTCASIIKIDEALILTNNKWCISNIPPNNFDYIFKRVQNTDSLYRFSYKKFNRFNSIKRLKLSVSEYPMADNDSFKNDIETLISFDENDHDSHMETNWININTLESILETCLFYPQIMIIEKTLYSSKHELVLEIELIDGVVVKLYIMKNECADGISLFKVINKLLKL